MLRMLSTFSSNLRLPSVILSEPHLRRLAGYHCFRIDATRGVERGEQNWR